MNSLYPKDDGPISDEYFIFLTDHVKNLLPSGELLAKSCLLEVIEPGDNEDS